MPLNASSMLAANQPQTPNGTALNASAMLGLPGLGNNLQDDLNEELKKRRAAAGMDDPTATGTGGLGAAQMIFGGMK